MDSPQFLYYWLIFSILVLVFIGVIVFLASRAGYFRDQDRARYLALWAEVPEETTGPGEAGHTDGRGKRN